MRGKGKRKRVRIAGRKPSKQNNQATIEGTDIRHNGRGRRSARWPNLNMSKLAAGIKVPGRPDGVSASHVSRILGGSRQGSVAVVLALADRLGVRPEEIRVSHG